MREETQPMWGKEFALGSPASAEFLSSPCSLQLSLAQLSWFPFSSLTSQGQNRYKPHPLRQKLLEEEPRASWVSEEMNRAFTIVRVSAEDQLKGYGPDVQWEDDILPNAPILGLTVDDKYQRVIQESATGWERSKFEAAVREAMALYR